MAYTDCEIRRYALVNTDSTPPVGLAGTFLRYRMKEPMNAFPLV